MPADSNFQHPPDPFFPRGRRYWSRLEQPSVTASHYPPSTHLPSCLVVKTVMKTRDHFTTISQPFHYWVFVTRKIKRSRKQRRIIYMAARALWYYGMVMVLWQPFIVMKDVPLCFCQNYYRSRLNWVQLNRIMIKLRYVFQMYWSEEKLHLRCGFILKWVIFFKWNIYNIPQRLKSHS